MYEEWKCFSFLFFGNKIKEENERHVWVCVKRRGEKSTTTAAINRKQYLPAIHIHTTETRTSKMLNSKRDDDNDNVKKGDSLLSFPDYETKTR